MTPWRRISWGGTQTARGIIHETSLDQGALMQALQGYEAGLDFPDSLHAALSAGEVAVITFDKRFASRAKHEEIAPPVELV